MISRIFFISIAVCAGGFAGGVAGLSKHVPTGADAAYLAISPQITIDASHLVSRDKREFVANAINRIGMPLQPGQIPAYLKAAIIAQEDHRFLVHSGLDWFGLTRAGIIDVLGGHVEGGSTLTQQVVKNTILDSNRYGFRGIVRKIKEAIVAVRLEKVVSKDTILTDYVNAANFGHVKGRDTIGVEEAAETYFHKNAQQLNLYECAVLAGMLKAPQIYNPAVDPVASNKQARDVLNKMVEQKFIRQNEAITALRIQSQPGRLEPVRLDARYYMQWTFEEIVHLKNWSAKDGIVRFVVGVDPWSQIRAETEIRELVAEHSTRKIQGALIAMTPNGLVRAVVGGSDFGTDQFDHATKAKRQPGSAFKAIVYAAAMQAGLRPDTIRVDSPIRIGGWQPENSDHRYLGAVTLRDAFALSRNTVATRLGQEIGIDKIIAEGHKLGITSELRRDATLPLGTSEVTVLELTSVYAAFANGGHVVHPYGVAMAVNSGQVIYRKETGEGPVVLGPKAVKDMRDMLRAVVVKGTGRRAGGGVWAAGKTGTSQGPRDGWFIGFRRDEPMVTGVWIGNDANLPIPGLSGGTLPADIWRRFNNPTEPFDARFGILASECPRQQTFSICHSIASRGKALNQ